MFFSQSASSLFLFPLSVSQLLFSPSDCADRTHLQEVEHVAAAQAQHAARRAQGGEGHAVMNLSKREKERTRPSLSLDFCLALYSTQQSSRDD